MGDTINGRTPEEIKNGLECCTVEYCYHTQKGCPYRDYSLCVQNVCEDALAYIQQLECERDEVLEFNKELVETNNNLFAEAVEMQNEINALRKELEQVKRERDAAVEDIRKAAWCCCHVCKHYYQPDPNVRIYSCKKYGDFDKHDFIADDGSIFCGAMEWRGVQEVE